MKRIIYLIVCAVLIIASVLTFSACNKEKAPEITTSALIDGAAADTCAYNKTALSSSIKTYCIANGKSPAENGDTFTVTYINGVGKISGSGNIGTAEEISAAIQSLPACPSSGTYTVKVTGTENNITVTVTCSSHG